jgi:hypothetical protein
LLFSLVSLAACKEHHEPPVHVPVPVRVPALPEPPEPPEPPPTAAATPRVRVVSGPASVRALAAIGQHIAVGAGAVVIDLEDGTRVTAAAGSELCALELAPSLLLINGKLRATRLPDPERSGTFRIASMAGAIETSPGLELLLRTEVQAGNQRTHLRLLRGGLTWLAPAASTPLQLVAGEPLPKPAPGLSWASTRDAAEAERTLEASLKATRKAPTDAEADHALDAALTQQHALRERSHALLAAVSPRHAALSSEEAAARPASTREYQRALVEHAQKREAQAGQLLSAAERSLLAVLARCGRDAASECAALAAWRARFAQRLASAL